MTRPTRATVSVQLELDPTLDVEGLVRWALESAGAHVRKVRVYPGDPAYDELLAERYGASPEGLTDAVPYG